MGTFASDFTGIKQRCVLVQKWMMGNADATGTYANPVPNPPPIAWIPVRVFFRPDDSTSSDAGRIECVVETGQCFGNVNGQSYNLPKYNFTLMQGATILVNAMAVSANTYTIGPNGDRILSGTVGQFSLTRWRWQSAPRKVVRAPVDLATLGLFPTLDPAKYVNAVKPSPQSFVEPLGGVMDSQGRFTGLDSAMGGVGDRPDLGPVTEWAGAWLATQDPTMLSSMFAQAEALNAWGMTYRDEATGAPIDFNVRTEAYGADVAPALGDLPNFIPQPGSSALTISPSHMPQLWYVAYLITGDPYYLEAGQLASAAHTLYYRYWRDITKFPLLFPNYMGEERFLAWALRDFAMCWKATPTATPSWMLSKNYFDNVLTQNANFNSGTLPTGATYVGSPFPWTNSSNAAIQKFHMQVDSGSQGFMHAYLLLMIAFARWLGRSEWKTFAIWHRYPETKMCLSTSTTFPRGATDDWPAGFACPYMITAAGAEQTFGDLFNTWAVNPSGSIPVTVVEAPPAYYSDRTGNVGYLQWYWDALGFVHLVAHADGDADEPVMASCFATIDSIVKHTATYSQPYNGYAMRYAFAFPGP